MLTRLHLLHLQPDEEQLQKLLFRCAAEVLLFLASEVVWRYDVRLGENYCSQAVIFVPVNIRDEFN